MQQRRARIGAVAAVALALAMTANGCFSEHTAGPTLELDAIPCTLSNAADLEGAGRAVVVIKDFAFHPDSLRVRPGTTVVWMNCDVRADPHTSTSDAGVWSSDFIVAGSTFSRRFDTRGVFPFHCTPHPFMKGVIVVDAAAPAVAPVASR